MKQLCCALACFLLTSCARQDKFAAFVDGYFDAANRWSPTAAVENGFHAYDSLIEERSPSAHNKRMRQLRIHLTDLGALREAGLTAEQTIDAEMIEAQVRADRHLIRVKPISIPGVQRVIAASLSFDPRPDRESGFSDFFTNAVTPLLMTTRTIIST